jgi:hypothetical protein
MGNSFPTIQFGKTLAHSGSIEIFGDIVHGCVFRELFDHLQGQFFGAHATNLLCGGLGVKPSSEVGLLKPHSTALAFGCFDAFVSLIQLPKTINAPIMAPNHHPAVCNSR